MDKYKRAIKLIDEENIQDPHVSNFGITDKLIGSLVNNLVKNLDKQFKDTERAEVKNFSNGIKIRIGPPTQQTKAPKQMKILDKPISSQQLEKMSDLPRIAAKSNIKRLSDKVIYELSTPGLNSTEDVFVSKLESGYETKAIGSKKIYVNNLQIDLPLKKLSILNNKLLIEFKSQEPAEIF